MIGGRGAWAPTQNDLLSRRCWTKRSTSPSRVAPPIPEKAAFIDADEPGAGHAIERAADHGLSVVLVSADGSTHILKPELSTH